jgi:hypothetical protein
MAVIDPRLIAAMHEQLAERGRLIEAGAHHVGWKLGMGKRESIGGHIAVGYLTSATVLEAGQTYAAVPGAQLHADAEACVELAGPDEIAGYGVALEVVDLAPRGGEPDSIVASNIFHSAVCFGPWWTAEPVVATVRLCIDGEERGRDRWPQDLRERIRQAAELLAAAGAGFAAGDRIITGSIVQVPIAAGNHVAAAVGDHAVVTVQIV